MSHPDNGNINVSVSNRIRASILLANKTVKIQSKYSYLKIT